MSQGSPSSICCKCVLVPGSHECHARVGRQRCGIGSHHGWAWRLWAIASLKRPRRTSEKQSRWKLMKPETKSMKLMQLYMKYHEII